MTWEGVLMNLNVTEKIYKWCIKMPHCFVLNQWIVNHASIIMITLDSSIGDKFCADTFEEAFLERPLNAWLLWVTVTLE